jgi:glycosyltransferase involved in cell wall biosynthesis
MINNEFKIILITPVYEDNEASGKFFEELSKIYKKDIFIIVIDDGSIKEPFKIEILEKNILTGIVLKLKKNVGHQRAIAIGLGYIEERLVKEQTIVIMDSDGEDLPSSIHVLIEELNNKNVDIVVAKRKNRIESLRFKLFYFLYKLFFKSMTGREISFGNFMVLKPSAVKRLVQLNELSIHIAATVISSKISIGLCPLDRGKRYAGNSKMNFINLLLHGFKAIMVFAEEVLVRVGIACVIIFFLSLVTLFIILMLKINSIATPGWFSIAIGIILIILLQTISLATIALMTLLLTGATRTSAVATRKLNIDYIASVIKTNEN